MREPCVTCVGYIEVPNRFVLPKSFCGSWNCYNIFGMFNISPEDIDKANEFLAKKQQEYTQTDTISELYSREGQK